MKVKLLSVLTIVAVLFIFTLVWRVDKFIFGDRLSWVEAQARTQTSSISHAIATELKTLQRLVLSFDAENFRKEKINWSSIAPYYAAVSFNVRGISLEPQVVLTKDKTPAALWSVDFVKRAVGTIDSKGGNKVFVKPFQDSNKGRHVAVIFIEGTRAIGLFGGGALFQSLIDAQKGSLNSLSVVTSAGLTVGHSIPEYLGTVMSEDVVFKDARSSEATQGSGVFKVGRNQELFGFYEQVPGVNMYVLSSAPLKDVMKGRSGLVWQFIFMGCGLALVGVAGVLLVVGPYEKNFESLEQQLLKAQAESAAVTPVEKTVIVDNSEGLQKEKMQAYMRIASALGHEMQGPLMSILGHSQMILARAAEPEVVQNTESILRETRSVREMLDKLFSFAGEEVKEKNSLRIEGPLARALKALDGLIAQKGVKLIKNFSETRSLDLNMDALTKVFESIISNSIEAMERMPKKEIKLDLYEDNEGVHLKIADTGEGIEPQNLDRIFDPFFTTRSFQNHMGLGLAVAMGVLKEHKAELQVSSERGKGTEVHIIFRKQLEVPKVMDVLSAPAVRVVESPLPVIEEKQEIVIAKELPQLSEKAPELEVAKAEFDASQEKTTVGPLDLNIESLLELPEVKEEKEDSAPAVMDDGATVIATSSKEAELAFLEDDGPTVIAAVDSFVPVNLITPPKTAPRVRESKLDSYHVDIRRPGKRD